MNKRNIGLDCLKVIATLFVIKLHSGYSGYTSELIHYVCGLAIPIFFMVSGALIFNKRGGQVTLIY